MKATTIARSIAAVFLGMVTAGALVVALTMLAVQVFFAGDLEASPTLPYLVVNLSYTAGAGAAGGWVAGLIAGRRAVAHGAAMGAIMLVLGSGGGRPDPASGIPWWYGYGVGVLGAAGALVGAWLAGRRQRSEPASPDA